jgi:formylglycine-generating enzyme required for sulfatase activity
MAKYIRVLCAVMALSGTLVHAAENDKKDTSSAPTKLVKNAAKESTIPLPPKPFKDPVTGLEMVFVKGGCYKMGDIFGNGGPVEKPAHEVCMDDFYIGKYEVTQGQWKNLMGNNPSANREKQDNYPVENVSWSDVQDFINKLNSMSGGNNYRLPTEAEWEYAARSGGKNERYSGGDILDDVAKYFDYDGQPDYNKGANPVGTRDPNGLGIYDMTGNVWEWINDWYASDYYSRSPGKNPKGPDSGERRVLRGGSWGNGAYDLRTTYRNFLPPDYRSGKIGFRLLRTI